MTDPTPPQPVPLTEEERLAALLRPIVSKEALFAPGYPAGWAERSAARLIAGRDRRAWQAPVHERVAQQELACMLETPLRLHSVAVFELRRHAEKRRTENEAKDGEHDRHLDEREAEALHRLASTTTTRSLKGA